MPPKKEEKKEIVRAFDPVSFWKYAEPDAQNVNKAANFLTTFDKQLKELINQQISLTQNYEILCDKMGYPVHPCLQNIKKQPSQYPELRNNDYGQKFAIFLNHKIDAVSLKVFAFLLSTYKINSIKFSNNSIDKEAEEILKLLQKQDSVTTLFFEWNPMENVQIRKDVFLSAVRPTIQHLILRQDHIGNQNCKQLITKIKSTPQMTLKSLDLSGNDLTIQISDVIANFVEEQKNLQFLGLSKNTLNKTSFLNKLFNSIGQIPLSQEQFAKHQENIKARDEVIERNKKKKKGAADEPVPFVLDVKQTEQGRFYVKNTSIKLINLAKNNIGDSSSNCLRKFIENQGKNVQIFLQGNKLTKKSKQVLKNFQNVLL